MVDWAAVESELRGWAGPGVQLSPAAYTVLRHAALQVDHWFVSGAYEEGLLPDVVSYAVEAVATFAEEAAS